MRAECTACGAPFEPVNARHSQCARCQVVRDLDYRISSRACSRCGRRFWPSRRHWRKCPDCLPTAAAHPDLAPCGVCHEPRPPAIGMARTCVACVQSSADLARRYLASLIRDLPPHHPLSPPPERTP